MCAPELDATLLLERWLPERIRGVLADGELGLDVDAGQLKYEECSRGLRRMGDILPVDQGTGNATYAMTLKQLEGLGCPTFAELPGGIRCAPVS